MTSSSLSIILLGIVCAAIAAHAQFYVDIEHSLPRIGKRTEAGAASSLNAALQQRQHQLSGSRRRHGSEAARLRELLLSGASAAHITDAIEERLRQGDAAAVDDEAAAADDVPTLEEVQRALAFLRQLRDQDKY